MGTLPDDAADRAFDAAREPKAPRPWLPGEKIGDRWFVHRAPHRSKMSVLYYCFDTALGQPVGAKSLLPQDMASASVRGRFFTECERWVALGNHPSIVEAHYVEMIDSVPYVFVEWVVGPDNCFDASLASWIQNHRPLRLDFVYEAALDVCDAFIHIAKKHHDQGREFIHRDLKPGNVLLSDDGTVKVTDFGLSSVLASEVRQGTGGKIAPGCVTSVAGTPPYMAPEQWRSGSPIDVRTDIYAFGCVLYEMLTSRQLFEAKTAEEWIEAHRNRPVQPPSQLRSDVPKALDGIVLACLAKEPCDRPSRFEVVKRRLLEAAGSDGTRPSGTAEPATESKHAGNPIDESLRLMNLGTSHDSLGQPERALTLYDQAERALLGSTGDVELVKYGISYNRAIALEHLDRYEEALNEWDQSLALVGRAKAGDPHIRSPSPSEPRTLVAKAKTLGRMGRTDDALEHCEQALTLESDLPDAVSTIAFLLVRAERFDEAVPWCERALRHNPKDLNALTNMGVSLGALGQTGRALEYFDRAIEVSSAHPEALCGKGTMLLHDKEYEEAGDYLRRAVALRPGYSEAWNHLGLALLQAGKEGYRDCFVKALEADPNNQAAQGNLAQLVHADATDFVKVIMETVTKGGGTVEFSPALLGPQFLDALTRQLDRFRDDFGQDLFFIRDAIPSLDAVRQFGRGRVLVVVNVERQGESVSMYLQVGYTPQGPDV